MKTWRRTKTDRDNQHGMGSLQTLETTIGFGAAYQYRTSKAALNMAMSILAKEVEPRGISVVIFSPGWAQRIVTRLYAFLLYFRAFMGSWRCEL